MKFFSKLEVPAYVLLRVIVGFLFSCYGFQKVLGLLGGIDGHGGRLHPSGDQLLYFVAGIIELVAGVLVLLGLGTRFAAFIASGEMAFAYFMGHASKGFFPIVNGGVAAVLFCFIFLYIAAHGTGKWGILRD